MNISTGIYLITVTLSGLLAYIKLLLKQFEGK